MFLIPSDPISRKDQDSNQENLQMKIVHNCAVLHRIEVKHYNTRIKVLPDP